MTNTWPQRWEMPAEPGPRVRVLRTEETRIEFRRDPDTGMWRSPAEDHPVTFGYVLYAWGPVADVTDEADPCRHPENEDASCSTGARWCNACGKQFS